MQHRSQLIIAGVTITMMGILAGCGTAAPSAQVTAADTSNQSATNPIKSTSAETASKSSSSNTKAQTTTGTSSGTDGGTSLNNKVIPSHGRLATSIPKQDYYLEVDFVDKSQKQMSVAIGHQLTTQGAGIQDHGPIFYRHKNRVTVYIPLGVVFETGLNGGLFAYFPPATQPVHQHAKSVWLLMYSGGTSSNYVLTGGKMAAKDLLNASATTNSAAKTTGTSYLTQAEQDGWKVSQRVNMQHNLTGYMGHNGWAKIPIGVPVNLVNSDGAENQIFEVKGVISQKQLLTTHPQLKTGIEAASVSP